MISDRKWVRGDRCTYFSPHLISITTLPCETQMFQIITQRCKNPENRRQQRILTPSIQDNETWIFSGPFDLRQFVHIWKIYFVKKNWRRWTQNTSGGWVGAVWVVDRWCRYQPVASSSKRLCSCTRDTLRTSTLAILNWPIIQSYNSARLSIFLAYFVLIE